MSAAPEIVGPDSRPARQVRSLACPRCASGVDRRVKSSGFGEPHDVCGKCGHEWSVEDSRG